MLRNKLKKLVQNESLLWGEEVAEDYHGAAARDMNAHWDEYIRPLIEEEPIDYKIVADFACGYGRNTDLLLGVSDHIVMIDVNKHNVEYCQKKYKDNPRVKVVECSGYNLKNIQSKSITFFYTFDSMVHFPSKLVISYLPEFFRVIEPGGYALVHHSNYTTGGEAGDFRQNPHWRNYMSHSIFKDIAAHAGFEVVKQAIREWGGVPELDCITVLRRPKSGT